MPEIVKPPIKCLAMEKKRIKIGREAITAAAISAPSLVYFSELNRTI